MGYKAVDEWINGWAFTLVTFVTYRGSSWTEFPRLWFDSVLTFLRCPVKLLIFVTFDTGELFWHLHLSGPSSFWREDPLSLWLGSFPRLIWFATCWTGLLFAFGRNSFLGGIKMKSWYSGWSSLWALEYLKQKTDKNEQKKHFIKNFYHNFLNQLYSNKSYLKFFKFFG